MTEHTLFDVAAFDLPEVKPDTKAEALMAARAALAKAQKREAHMLKRIADCPRMDWQPAAYCERELRRARHRIAKNQKLIAELTAERGGE